MKKRVSVKMLFAVLWRGVCQTVRATGRLLGVKNGWGYTRVVWRLVAGVIATFVLAFCITALWHFLDEMVYRFSSCSQNSKQVLFHGEPPPSTQPGWRLSAAAPESTR